MFAPTRKPRQVFSLRAARKEDNVPVTCSTSANVCGGDGWTKIFETEVCLEGRFRIIRTTTQCDAGDNECTLQQYDGREWHDQPWPHPWCVELARAYAVLENRPE